MSAEAPSAPGLTPRRCSGTLPKYCIGDVALAPGEAPPTTYEEDLAEGQFYHTLKKRVDAYFKDNQARVACAQPRTLAGAAVPALMRLGAPRSWIRVCTPRCS